MGIFLESFILFGLFFELHAFHALEFHRLSIFLGANKANTLKMIPLSTNFALEHVSFVLIRLFAYTENAPLYINKKLHS